MKRLLRVVVLTGAVLMLFEGTRTVRAEYECVKSMSTEPEYECEYCCHNSEPVSIFTVSGLWRCTISRPTAETAMA